MLRGPLYEDSYRPQLSGHETFPLRYGWLKKAYDAVRNSEDQADNGEVFSGPDAIARFWHRQEHGLVHAALGGGRGRSRRRLARKPRRDHVSGTAALRRPRT